jgi:hypothetical protein
MGLEGIVSKRLGSIYRSGKSKDWLKFKNPNAPAVKRKRIGDDENFHRNEGGSYFQTSQNHCLPNPNGNAAEPTNASPNKSKHSKPKLRHNDSKSLSVLSYSPITLHD